MRFLILASVTLGGCKLTDSKTTGNPIADVPKGSPTLGDLEKAARTTLPSSLVLGQPSDSENLGLARGLNRPMAIHTYGDHLFVADAGNARVLVFDKNHMVEPLTVLGSPTPHDLGGGMVSPSAVFFNGEELAVVDSGQGQVFFYEGLPKTGDEPVRTLTVEQPQAVVFWEGAWVVADGRHLRVYEGEELNQTQEGRESIKALAVNGQRLFVAQGNQVVWYEGLPLTQSRGEIRARAPTCVLARGRTLVVCDPQGHRVLVWDDLNDESPSRALGQRDLRGEDRALLDQPMGLALDQDHLYVVDAGFHRVLLFEGIPQEDGVKAKGVLGQPTLDGTQPNYAGVASDLLYSPNAVTSTNQVLIASDARTRRLVLWTHSNLKGQQYRGDVLENVGALALHTDGKRLVALTDEEVWTWNDVPLRMREPDEKREHGIEGIRDAYLDGNRLVVAAQRGVATLILGEDLEPTWIVENKEVRAVTYTGQQLVVALEGGIVVYEGLPQAGEHPSAVLRNLPGVTSLTYKDNALLATQSAQNRVLILPGVVTQETQPLGVLGQGDLHGDERNSGGINSASLANPVDTTLAGPYLVVADQGNQRLTLRLLTQ